MKRYIDCYINLLEARIKYKKIDSSLKDDVLIKINFFNKERIIHLIITLFYLYLLFYLYVILENLLFI